MSVKEIAADQGISLSAVNQHIRALKDSLGVNSLSELSATFETLIKENGCTKSADTKSSVVDAAAGSQSWQPDATEPVVTFHDSLRYESRPPWQDQTEPSFVPRVLDGANAKWVRALYVIGVALGFMAIAILGLGFAQGLSAIGPHWATSSAKSGR